MTTFVQFVEALVEPEKRAAIGLVITDADAATLIGNKEWAENYFAQWVALAKPGQGSAPVQAAGPATVKVPAPVTPLAAQAPVTPALTMQAQTTPAQTTPAQARPTPVQPPARPYVQPPPVYAQPTVPHPALQGAYSPSVAPTRSGGGSAALWIVLSVVGLIVVVGIVLVILFVRAISAPTDTVSQPVTVSSTPAPVPTPSVTVAPSTRNPVDVSQRKGDKSGGYVSPFTESQQWTIDEFKRAGGFSTSARQVLGGADIAEVQDVDKDLLAYFDAKCDAGIAEPQNFDFYVDLLIVEGDYTEEKSGRVVNVIIDYCEGRPVAG